MDRKLLNTLMKVKEYPCISILLPTHRTAPDNQKNAIRIKNGVKQATEKLENEFGKKESKELVDKIKTLAASVDISRTLDGLALFVSKEVSQMVDIPFTVRERVIIDKTFATRDLIMGVNRGTHYYILDLSLHRARLISCFRDQAQEVSHNGFPINSDFPMLDLNPTDFSREKEKQIKEFFNKVDKLFISNYHDDSSRLVLAGVQKNLALYKDVADMKEIILGQIEGNYESVSAHDLGKKAWEVVRERNRQDRHNALKEIQDAVSAQKFASGISEAWRFANEGRVSLLVVEEGFNVSAGIEDNNVLVMDISNLPEKKIMPDAVDEVAEIVIEKGGKVVFVDDGTLGKHHKIAAILRY
jgi:hypothetical protein